MARLTNLKPRIATLDTRLSYGDATVGLTPDQAYDRVRQGDTKTRPLYGTAKWKRLRAAQLEAEPLCQMCIEMDGRAVAATVCDHVTPHRGDVEAFWAGPFQSLCRHHHDSLKQLEESSGRLG